MEKRAILFFFIIFLFPLASAIDINMNLDIQKGETIIASISGNFFDPIMKDNIYFYRGHVRTSFDYDVAKIGDNYYIYIQTVNKGENNYSINISGVRYFVGSQISNEPFSKSFRIINETADFLVNPGFVITEGNFTLKIQNLQPIPIIVELETEVGQDVTLSSGEIKTLNINLKDISKTEIRTITLGTGNTNYEIPCYIIFKDILPVENTTNETESEGTNLIADEECSFLDKLFGDCETEDIQNKTEENTDSGNESNFEDNQNDTAEDNEKFENASSGVDYEIVKDGSKTIAVKDGEVLSESATSKTCSQIKGKVCSSGEICQNSTIYTKDAKCCISECVKEETGVNTKVIGWVMLGVLFLIILRFFAVKFRKTKNKKDTLLGFRR